MVVKVNNRRLRKILAMQYIEIQNCLFIEPSLHISINE